MDLINTCFETTNEVRALAYYSHLFPTLISLGLGVLAVRYANNKTKAWLFFSFTILLSLWLIGDLVAWTSNSYFAVAAFWSTLDYLNILFYLFIFTFVIVDFSKTKKLNIPTLLFVLFAALLPFLVTMAGTAVHEFDEPNCEMYGNDFLALYKLVIEWLVIAGIVVVGLYAGFKNRSDNLEIKRIAFLTLTSTAFLAIFSGSEFVATYTDIYEINLYALFALPVFILLLTYTILEQGTFNLKLDSIWYVRIIFTIFVLLEVFNLFLADGSAEIIVSVSTVVATLGFGLLFLRTAGKEAKQRQEIEQLAKKLEKANHKLKLMDQMKSEFVSIASHQLRSPLTSIRGYASMLLEGSYGKLTPKGKDAVERISESSRYMALSVEDYLNVSRIEAGRMKYEITDFNLKEMVEQITDDVRPGALKKGLVIRYKSTELTGRGFVQADPGKTHQIVHNLLDNAMKYTPKGSITVELRDNKKKKRVYVAIKDTGVGMSAETLEDVFEKFVRAKNANKVNVTGTGLGLFVAKQMAEGMGGAITPHSDGEGKGSTFTLELPYSM